MASVVTLTLPKGRDPAQARAEADAHLRAMIVALAKADALRDHAAMMQAGGGGE